jgi:hypothetical protein
LPKLNGNRCDGSKFRSFRNRILDQIGGYVSLFLTLNCNLYKVTVFSYLMSKGKKVDVLVTQVYMTVCY